MKPLTLILAVLVAGGLYAAAARAETPALARTDLDTARIEQLTGAKGTLFKEEGVFKVGLARGDLAPTVAGVKITVPMGLGAWAAFTRAGDTFMVMGDMVLAEDQVNPVMSAALDNGLSVTALHNHFLWDSPRVMFMHIGGSGDQEKLAAAVGKVFARIKDTMGGKGETPKADIDPSKTALDVEKIAAVLGVKGDLTGGAYKITIGRTTTMHGAPMGNAMGVNTWAAFAGTDEKAVVDGDFAMTEAELQTVLKTLRKAGINIVAIHNHMTMESPRIMFLHYWGVGPAADLAKALKAALDAQAALSSDGRMPMAMADDPPPIQRIAATATVPVAETLSGAVEDGVRVVKMTAKRFEYDPKRVVVRQGEKVRLEITAQDVTHGLALSDFKIDLTLPPKEIQKAEFVADKPGSHEFHCTVFCGLGHMGMKGELVVLPAK